MSKNLLLDELRKKVKAEDMVRTISMLVCRSLKNNDILSNSIFEHTMKITTLTVFVTLDILNQEILKSKDDENINDNDLEDLVNKLNNEDYFNEVALKIQKLYIDRIAKTVDTMTYVDMRIKFSRSEFLEVCKYSLKFNKLNIELYLKYKEGWF